MLRLFLAAIASVSVTAGHCLAATAPSRIPTHQHVTPSRGNSVLTSSSTGVRFKASAGPDTFCLYGGPNNPTEGKFQNAFNMLRVPRR